MKLGKEMDALDGEVSGQNEVTAAANLHQGRIVANPEAQATSPPSRLPLEPPDKIAFTCEHATLATRLADF
jgi:hypothetical protein